MLHYTIKDDMIQAWKAKDGEAKDVLSMLLSKIKNKAIDLRVDELSDADTISLIQKFIKEMEDEVDAFKAVGRTETVEKLTRQLDIVRRYLPKMMSEEEIRNKIEQLEDKSMKNIMTYFKTNFPGKVDMGTVSKIARNL